MWTHETDDVIDVHNDSSSDDDEDSDDKDDISGEDLKPLIEKVQESLKTFENLLQRSVLVCTDCDTQAKNQNGPNACKGKTYQQKLNQLANLNFYLTIKCQ